MAWTEARRFIMSENLYAYDVVEDADFELDIEGVDGAERAYTVNHDPLAAVVSDIDTNGSRVEVER